MCALALNLSRRYDADLDTTTGDIVTGAVMAVVFGWFGGLIVSRRPGHRVGWILCAMGVSLGVAGFASEYAILGFVRHPGAVPGAAGAAWIASWSYAVELGLLTALFTLFPTGHPPSRRWWPVVWAAGVAAILSVVAAVSSWPTQGISMMQRGGDEPQVGVFRAFYTAGFVALLACVVLGAASLAVRFRRTDGDQRAQIKLLLFVVVAAIAAVAILSAIGPLLGTSELSAQLRDEVELDVLTTRLHVVIAVTMQPTTGWLWLR